MSRFLAWLLPARIWAGEWTEPAPSNFEYQMLMLRMRIQQLARAWLESLRQIVEGWKP